MKIPGVVTIVMLSLLILGSTAVFAQQSREEVPGDHFSLEGALELFKRSASPEEFERLLNSANSEVNNLDLNGDGDIDYIKVIDRYEGNVHAFILQAIISDRESQDVAVIELEKLANGKAILQITGDADIYGIETIIEPTEEVRINAGASTARAVVNVWTWPSVQYVYSPYYYGWVSPWSWSYWPGWWRPWRPVAYYYYYPRWEPYRSYYSVCYTHRVVYAQEIYRPYRNTSVIVYNRHHTQITNYRSSRSDSHYNRGRDNESRQISNTYERATRERQLPENTQRRTSNSSSDWGRNSNELSRERSTATRYESPFGNRSSNDINKTPSSFQRNSGSMQRRDLEGNSELINPSSTRQRDGSSFENRSNNNVNRMPFGSQRNSNGMQRQNSERSSGLVIPNNGSRLRDGSSFGNRSGNDVSRPFESQGYGNTKQSSRIMESRPSIERGSQQRSAVQTERRVSPGSPGTQRSGSGGVGNKLNEHKRGRD